MNALKLLACSAALGLGTLLASSCSEKELYIPPVANNTADEFYKDEAQVNQGVIAIYNGALSFPQSSNWNMSEFRSDNINAQVQTVQRDFSDISNFTATSQLGQLQATWTDLFEVVYRSNILLEKIQPFSFARVNQFKGEARFMRAYAYFDLVRYWGPVPIADHVLGIEESKTVPRAPIADVYKLIVDDLTFAAANLPASYGTTDKGRATKWAAKAMLARVYLTMYGYPLRQTSALPLAKQQLMDVYAAAGPTTFSMAANFADLFKTVNDNKYAVFEIQYASGGVGLGSTIPWDQGSVFPSWWSPFAPSQTDITPSPDFLGRNWSLKDLRRKATLDTVYVNPTTNAITVTRAQYTKFLEKGTTAPQNNRDYSNNFPIIRFEDVMLMYAEVLTEESGSVPPLALTLVNQIRTRSGIPAYTATSPEAASKTAFLDAIQKERKYEFAAEGLRWFDLVRTGRAISVMTAYKRLTTPATARQLDEHDLLFPIPLLELRINPGFWQQNPGYN
ncbi:RagB/SusD family nutrient uptake outer membrane protein [Hymenobacter sp. BT770]|uniref:RagB/SusD family nutrient uptake outer membrane protein n=1 Tax=Hymenobacter sp. BT770 TaxID=2886942 RepID=UPI001D0FD48B|nr:RagB/SusD family nutrient uptake outer membrane protein [Hymenobacter sp. BT770]MCC3154966.1 RagB/SusD family nutrient uptake outer membrane protein [Hymenobacter sp. BT770]MDO3416862.1 RagB/SusD family nutrient uptake outer membrane protein [Hymenobacter sp. BT770]